MLPKESSPSRSKTQAQETGTYGEVREPWWTARRAYGGQCGGRAASPGQSRGKVWERLLQELDRRVDVRASRGNSPNRGRAWTHYHEPIKKPSKNKSK